MTRTLWSRTASTFLTSAYAASALLAYATGCGSSKSTATCAAGDETCPCYGNHTCNGSLTCASGVCVDLAGGSAGGGGATATGGSASSTTHVLLGGSTGLTATTAGSDSAGGVTQMGGTSNLSSNGTVGGSPAGGTVATGGLGNIGGVVGIGGATGLGGAVATGGGVNTGDSSALGGAAITGGGASITTGSNTGGQNPVGGAPNTGAIGGGAAGGQISTTGGAAPDTCGNGTVEGTEGCDPSKRDNDLGDGCTPLCKVEPNCPAAPGACTTRCGDGFVLAEETCDDGNTVAGDGCSASCQMEPDFDCAQSGLSDTRVIPMVVRDFLTGGDFEKGTAFSTGLYFANQGLLENTLNVKGKPVLASTTGVYDGLAGEPSGIASAASFAQWYDDAAVNSGNSYNATQATSMRLHSDSSGVYANRSGANGEQWIRESFGSWCGYVGSEAKDAEGKPIPCTYCLTDDPATPECDQPYAVPCDDRTDFLRCEVRQTNYYGVYAEATFDGTPLFFPADSLAPASPATKALIPGYYDPAWPSDPGGATHNFSFTTEVRFWFKYDASQTLRLNFVGDDDAWVFVNKTLALDIGGIHVPVSGQLVVNTDGSTKATVASTYDTTSTPAISNPSLGLEDGKIYEVAIFQAERQTTSSSYALAFNGFSSGPSVCIHR